jgi:hypothetical protein
MWPNGKNACLASVRPWVPAPVQKKEEEEEEEE